MSASPESGVAVSRRDPAMVMRLARLGAVHQCRLSFMRILTRRMKREKWDFTRPVFDIDATGVGHAVYTATGPERAYSLVAFAHDLPPEKRSDRVIATAWDATFTLFDGAPTAHDIERLSKNIPLQEAGRVSEKEISVSRANRSVRLWEYVVASLAAGRQPDRAKTDAVGYLMRSTAVYGSGKLGAADREALADRPEFATPFQAEMLSVFLTRAFVRDLVQHMADSRGAERAVRLDPEIARAMGIGNSTGLGLAPFLLNHPVLLNNWVLARETAIARVRSVETATPAQAQLFRNMLARSVRSAALWHSEHPVQIGKLADLRNDMTKLSAHVAVADLNRNHPWNRLYRWGEAELSVEGQENLASLILEPYGDLVDELGDTMSDNAPAVLPVDGTMSLARLQEMLATRYGWALSIDWDDTDSRAQAWYVSAEKLEPRIGKRFQEPIEPYELPLSPAHDAAALSAALDRWPAETSVGEFLLRHPEHRHIARRVQMLERAPYGEIHDNTIGADVFPIDMMRFKLGFFGATHFDPRSDRWVRISMYGNAPYPEELATRDADFWPYPDHEG